MGLSGVNGSHGVPTRRGWGTVDPARATLPAPCLGPAGGGGRAQQRGVPRSGPRARSRSGSGPRSGSRATGAGLGMFGGEGRAPPLRRARSAEPPRALRRQRRPAGGGGLCTPLRSRNRSARGVRVLRHSAGRGLEARNAALRPMWVWYLRGARRFTTIRAVAWRRGWSFTAVCGRGLKMGAEL